MERPDPHGIRKAVEAFEEEYAHLRPPAEDTAQTRRAVDTLVQGHTRSHPGPAPKIKSGGRLALEAGAGIAAGLGTLAVANHAWSRAHRRGGRKQAAAVHACGEDPLTIAFALLCSPDFSD